MEPLNLPRGSVRAIITILLVGVCGLTLFLPVQEGADEARAMFVLLTGIAVRDYFVARRRQEDDAGPALPDPIER